MSSEILILIGTLGGALIGALTTLAVTWLNKRSEERKHYRELIINLALENYKEERAMARAILERRPGISQRLYPLDVFILHMARLADVVINKKLQRSEVSRVLADVDEFTAEVYAHYNEREQRVTEEGR